jgi:hypothetical protein
MNHLIIPCSASQVWNSGLDILFPFQFALLVLVAYINIVRECTQLATGLGVMCTARAHLAPPQLVFRFCLGYSLYVYRRVIKFENLYLYHV